MKPEEFPYAGAIALGSLMLLVTIAMELRGRLRGRRLRARYIGGDEV